MHNSQSLNVLAGFFIFGGLILVLENFGVLNGVSRFWPLCLLFVGAGFLLLYFERGRGDPVLLWIGTYLCQVGAFFLMLNFYGWRWMAQFWPLFLGFCGTSFFSIYLAERRALFLHIALGFLLLCLVFYLVFGVSLSLWPTSLIFFGLSLLIVNRYYRKVG